MNTTSQVCTRCQKDKDLSEFHHRRGGYQKICKECRNSSARVDYQTRGKSRKNQSPVIIQTNNFQAMSERITKLDAKLKAKASAFAHDNLDADDIYSAMVEAILTRCQPEDTDAFLMQKASWVAQDFVARSSSYNQYVDNLDVDADESEGIVFSIGTSHSIENTLVRNETMKELEKIIKSLPQENQQLISMIAVGKPQKEMAAELHVSEQTISERVRRLREILHDALAPDMRLSFA